MLLDAMTFLLMYLSRAPISITATDNAPRAIKVLSQEMSLRTSIDFATINKLPANHINRNSPLGALLSNAYIRLAISIMSIVIADTARRDLTIASVSPIFAILDTARQRISIEVAKPIRPPALPSIAPILLTLNN